jgi:hypothetical protein
MRRLSLNRLGAGQKEWPKYPEKSLPVAERMVETRSGAAAVSLRKRRLEFRLKEQHRADRRVRPDKTSRIAKPFGDAQGLLDKKTSS